MNTREVQEAIRAMSLKELREALEFHFTHMKLLHQEVDERITKLTEENKNG